MAREDEDRLLAAFRAHHAADQIRRRRILRGVTARLEAGDPGLPDGDGWRARLPGARPLVWLAALALVGAGAGLVGWRAGRDGRPMAEAPATAALGSGTRGRIPALTGAGTPPAPAAQASGVPAGCRGVGTYVISGPATAARPAWRGYLDTVPSHALLAGIGASVNLNELRDVHPDALMASLAQHGVRTVLMEINWDALDPEYERLSGTARGRRALTALSAAARHGLRPVVRLAAHESSPCPLETRSYTLASAAAAGTREVVVVEPTTALVAGRSGLSRLSGNIAAEALVVAIHGARLRLSRPLPTSLAAGARVAITTLAYEPFASPGTPASEATTVGWLRFVDRVAASLTELLGTERADDKGFDLELGHSLTFGARFLWIGNYHDPAPPVDDPDRTWRDLLTRTAAHLASHPERFAGVRLANGFLSRDGGARCADQPDGVTAIARRELRPTARTGPITPLQAVERLVSGLEPVDLSRELVAAPGARCRSWISGSPDAWLLSPRLSPERALAVTAKLALRQYAFFLNKGAERVYLPALPERPGPRATGLLPVEALAQLRTTDASARSPALEAVSRLVTLVEAGAEARPSEPQRLAVRELWECHGRTLAVHGESVPACELMAVLPFQRGDGRHAIAYYVATPDPTTDLPPARYGLRLAGVRGRGARVAAHDLLSGRELPVIVQGRGEDELTVEVEATDAPRVLVVDEP
jgi:hypothetical protein